MIIEATYNNETSTDYDFGVRYILRYRQDVYGAIHIYDLEDRGRIAKYANSEDFLNVWTEIVTDFSIPELYT